MAGAPPLFVFATWSDFVLLSTSGRSPPTNWKKIQPCVSLSKLPFGRRFPSSPPAARRKGTRRTSIVRIVGALFHMHLRTGGAGALHSIDARGDRRGARVGG